MANLVETYKNAYLLSTHGMIGVVLHIKPPDKFLTVINLANGHEIARHPQPLPLATELNAIAINPTQKFVAYSQSCLLETRHDTFEYSLNLWDIDNRAIRNHIVENNVSSIVWYDPTKCLFVTNNQCFLWDTTTPTSPNFKRIGEGGHKLAIHNAMLALCGNNTIRIINPMTQAILHEIQLDGVLSGFGNCYSPNGDLFAFTLRKNLNEVLLWDIQHNRLQPPIKTQNMVTAIAWSPDTSQLLIINYQAGVSHLAVWDIASQQEIQHLADVQGRILQATWIGNTILAGNDDLLSEVSSQIWVWQV
ncbi:MAG: WD40 repeat domain-containing protein [Anaerolineae bacterium]|nr:WD40 repeat domain-containing protein [Anaerolineae bacterium]